MKKKIVVMGWLTVFFLLPTLSVNAETLRTDEQSAAANGDVRAQVRLGVMYASGKGETRNLELGSAG
jgi:hypothetical protein